MSTQPAQADNAFQDALLRGFAESGAGLCLCDAEDRIRFVNARFREAFIPQFDGQPKDFIGTVLTAVQAGTGVKLSSADPEEFACRNHRERRDLIGSRSFSTDMVDGGWWSVTHTKLSNGWILIVAQDITGLKREEARLRDAHHLALTEANTDYLTGIPNRRHGLREAQALWRATQAEGEGFAVALLDIDHFKTINDVYGHETGDQALRHLASFVMAALATHDQISRLGGDEFLILRPGSDAHTLESFLADIVAIIPPLDVLIGAEQLRLSFSIGIAEARRGETWPELMHRADMALYTAKAGGRGRTARAA